MAALNVGLAASRGELVARFDADDRMAPDRLARQDAVLAADPGLGAVACRVTYGGDPVRGAGFARFIEWNNALLSSEAIALNRFVESPVIHPTVMFRREVASRLGGYEDGPFPEDYDLWLRWMEAGVRFAKLPEALVTWNERPERLSRRDARYGVEAFYALKARHLARWLARHNPHHPRVTVWGAGELTRRRAERLVAHGVAIERYVDIDPRKIGRRIRGRPVIAPEELPPPGGDFVLAYVGTRGARELIAARLDASGRRLGVDYLPAA